MQMTNAFRKLGLRLLGAIAVGLAGITYVSAQDQPVAFTSEQAERGHTAYRSACQDCHGTSLDNGEFGGPPLKGGYFRGHWGEATVAVLLGYMSAAMPPDRPGQLSPQTYVDLVAFILLNNGYQPGNRELPLDPDVQQKMTLKK